MNIIGLYQPEVVQSLGKTRTVHEFLKIEDLRTEYSVCTAYGFLDHSLKEDCATIQSQLKGVSDGETKKIHP